MDGADDARQHHHKAHIALRVLAGIEQINAGVSCHAPVVVLAAAVGVLERLLVQQQCQLMALGDLCKKKNKDLTTLSEKDKKHFGMLKPILDDREKKETQF